MRNTRTVAACVAATTLFGLLSASPALAAQLDDRGGATAFQGEAPGASGPALLGRHVTGLAAAQADRGDIGMLGDERGGAGMLGSEDAVGSDVRLPGRPLPAVTTDPARSPESAPSSESAPSPESDGSPESVPTSVPVPTVEPPEREAAESVVSPERESAESVLVERVGDQTVLTLPDAMFSSDRRFVVIARGQIIAQLSHDVIHPEAEGFWVSHQEGVPNYQIGGLAWGDRVEVWEYDGSFQSGLDVSLRKESVLDSYVYNRPAMSASVSGDELSLTLPDTWLRRDRFVAVVNGKPVAEMRDNVYAGADRIAIGEPGIKTLLISGVHAGDRLEVWTYEGAVESGLDDSLRKARVLDQRL